MISSAAVLLCLEVLKVASYLVVMNQSSPYGCCGFGRSRHPEKVDRRTAIHWAFTNAIVQLQGLRSEHAARHASAGDFVRRHRISSPLALRIRRYIGSSGPECVRDTNADALRRSSIELIVDLLEEMRVPAFSAHPFFVNLRAKHPHLVRELCQEALQPLLRHPDQLVFRAGDVSSRMYVLISGHALYTASVHQQDAPPGSPPTLVKRALRGGQWLSEAALWTGWVHRGELWAVTECLFFALDASGFAQVISSHKSAHTFAAAYARKFVEGLNRGLQTDVVEAGPIDN